MKTNSDEKKTRKTALELKEDLLQYKKQMLADVNKKIKLIEKKEKEKKLKPYFKLVEKYVDNITDKDLETMMNYIETRFKKK